MKLNDILSPSISSIREHRRLEAPMWRNGCQPRITACSAHTCRWVLYGKPSRKRSLLRLKREEYNNF